MAETKGFLKLWAETMVRDVRASPRRAYPFFWPRFNIRCRQVEVMGVVVDRFCKKGSVSFSIDDGSPFLHCVRGNDENDPRSSSPTNLQRGKGSEGQTHCPPSFGVSMTQSAGGRAMQNDCTESTLRCVLWKPDAPWLLPQGSSAHVADIAACDAQWLRLVESVEVGRLLRVRGWVKQYRGRNELEVVELKWERDPNTEVLHWLECIELCRDLERGVPLGSHFESVSAECLEMV